MSPFLIPAGFVAAMLVGYVVGHFRGWHSGLNSWIELKIKMDGPDEEEDEIVEVVPDGVLKAIMEANPDRGFDNYHRRTIKLMEELGELSEAYLNVTSASNGKEMTYADVREEAADCVIVAVDLALTPTPDQVAEGISREEVVFRFVEMIAKKLAKWKRNRDTGKAATDAE